MHEITCSRRLTHLARTCVGLVSVSAGGLKFGRVMADAFIMGLSGEGQAAARSVSERLKAATDELQKLEKLVVSGDCAPRVLNDFRGAVDSIRQTAWAVQQWSEDVPSLQGGISRLGKILSRA